MTPAQRTKPQTVSERLTEHFALAEFLRSEAAERMGNANLPTAEHKANLLALARVLEQVRRWAGGRVVTVHSGYRNPAVNEAVGGVANSAHALGFAADITVEGLTARQLAILIRDRAATDRIHFDQLILETSRGVVHLSIDPRARMQVLTQAGGPGSPVAKGIIGG